MHSPARQGIEIDCQGGYQGLAFTGAHLGDPALVQHHAADQLHVEMTHAQHPPGNLADRGEGLGQQVVKRGSVRQTLAELGGFGHQLFIGKRLDLCFQCVDPGDGPRHALEFTIVTTAEDLAENIKCHECLICGYRGSQKQTGMIPQLPVD